MIWHYHCPDCGHELQVPWDDVKDNHVCPACRAHHYPPMPTEDHSAYVGGDRWPREIEEAVIALRGTVCSVRGCYRDYKTLGRRRSSLKGGRLSVDNLLQLCALHAREMGERDFDEFVAELPRIEPGPKPATFEVTITTRSDTTAPTPKVDIHPASPPVGEWAGVVLPITGHVGIAGSLPAGVRVIAAAPFLPGQSQRLFLLYDWMLDTADACFIILAAWPNSRSPDLSKGVEDLEFSTSRIHRRADGQRGSGELSLDLPGASRELWTAVLLVKCEQALPPVTSWFIASGAERRDDSLI